MEYRYIYPLQVDTGVKNSTSHLAHHNHLVLFQQARLGYLGQFGYTEKNIEGTRMFIVEAHCVYKKELFHRDLIVVKCCVDQIKPKLFSMSYEIEKNDQVCARGYTKSVCVDPELKKTICLPQLFVSQVTRHEHLDLSRKQPYTYRGMG